MEHYKVARYYMADEHSRVPEVQLASGRTWDALPEEYRQTLQACARASAQYERQLWAQEETAARKAALAGGCQELPLPEEKCRTSGSWCSRYTENTVPTICRWWKRYRQSDNRKGTSQIKRLTALRLYCGALFLHVPTPWTANKPDPLIWLVCNIQINVSAEYPQGAAEDLLNQKLSLSSHIHRSR